MYHSSSNSAPSSLRVMELSDNKDRQTYSAIAKPTTTLEAPFKKPTNVETLKAISNQRNIHFQLFLAIILFLISMSTAGSALEASESSSSSSSESVAVSLLKGRRLCGRLLIETLKRTCARGTALPCFHAGPQYSILSHSETKKRSGKSQQKHFDSNDKEVPVRAMEEAEEDQMAGDGEGSEHLLFHKHNRQQHPHRSRKHLLQHPRSFHGGRVPVEAEEERLEKASEGDPSEENEEAPLVLLKQQQRAQNHLGPSHKLDAASRFGLAQKCCSVEGCDQTFIEQFCCSSEQYQALAAQPDPSALVHFAL